MASDADCPSEETLLDVVAGRVELARDRGLERHVAACDACRAALASLVRDAGAGGSRRAVREEGALARGDRLADRYLLERLVGAGGMGAVWEARDEQAASTDARVAVKVLRRFDDATVRRQRREARIAASLRHPNIVPVLDVVDDGEGRGPALVMPLLEGETLEHLLARTGKLSVTRAAPLLVPLLDALAHAHRQGVVHRDVKPQNVLVTKDGVFVLDFGIAKQEGDAAALASRITRTGEVLGTPRYMAPEQIFGERDVDARADVWSAGVIAYRMLCGEPPIHARTLGETIKAHARGRIVPLHERVAAGEVPDPLAAAVMACLERDRARRPSSTDPLRDALVAASALDS